MTIRAGAVNSDFLWQGNKTVVLKDLNTIIPTNDMKNPKFDGITEGVDPSSNPENLIVFLDADEMGKMRRANLRRAVDRAICKLFNLRKQANRTPNWLADMQGHVKQGGSILVLNPGNVVWVRPCSLCG